MTPSQKLLGRLRELGLHVPSDAVIERLYHGRHQRAAGAWSWHIASDSGYYGGSQWTVRECLAAKELVFGFNGEITPEIS